MNVTANILAFVAEAIGLAANYNQLVHIIRKKTSRGVSGWAWTLSVGGNIAWVVYGTQHRIAALVLANVILVCIGFTMIRRLYKSSSERSRMLAYSVMVGIGLSVVFVKFPKYSGWLALLYGTLARLPQLYRAFHDKHLEGLSYGSQIAFYAENSLTGIYALLLGAWPLVTAALIGFFTSGYMVFIVAKKGKTP